MTEFLDYAVLGLGLAAIYALLSQGVVLIYRGSGVVNFAHGAFGLVGAGVFVELHNSGWPAVPALLAALLAGAALGAIVQNAIMRLLRSSTPLTRTVATIGVLLVIQSAEGLHYGSSIEVTAQFLPQNAWKIGGVSLPADQVLLFAIAAAMAVVLTIAQRYWLVGLATRAGAENELGVSSLGWSPNTLATVNWMIGGALAGLAGALIVPVTGLIVGTLVLLIVPTLAAALIGRFDSFGWGLLGAAIIGIAQAIVIGYTSQTGATDAVPLAVIVLVLVVTKRELPLRSHLAERLPKLGTGTIRPLPLLMAVALVVVGFLYLFDASWVAAGTVTFATSTILLSLVVVTGYAGQISLAQYAMAGLSAYIAGRLVAAAGWGFLPAAIVGVLAAIPIGALVGIPALRTRGVNLAVVTLALGVAVNSMLFSNVNYTGGASGTQTGTITLFGLDVSPLDYPARYGIVCLAGFTLAALAVANLRRAIQGRRMIAIRANERAAASLGVPVAWTKVYAFVVASMIAGLGGVLLAFQNFSVIFATFNPVNSLLSVGYAVIGGVGFIAGPLTGSVLASGGLASLLSGLLSSIATYLGLIGAIALIITLVTSPSGIVAETLTKARWPSQALRRAAVRVTSVIPAVLWGRPADSGRLLQEALALSQRERVTPKELRVDGLTVRYGGVVANNGISLSVAPGEVVGLIGPNGAGKTTVIDAVTGFARVAEGDVKLGGTSVTRLRPDRRVAAGLGRSWQALELFEDITVLENLQVAAEARSGMMRDAVRSLLAPRRARLTAAAAQAVVDFDLADDLDRRPEELSYGRRRLVAIARAVALRPSVLLLDEPAAGISDRESAELGTLVRTLATDWGIGILLVEHDVDMVMNTCDRIVVLNFGTKIAEGTPAQIRESDAVAAAYLGEASKGEDVPDPVPSEQAVNQ